MWFSLFKHSEKSVSATGKVLILFGVASIIFAIGYALRPISEIVDELHDDKNNESNN